MLIDMNVEANPEGNTKVCCELCKSSSCGVYLCEQCASLTCFLHAALWQDDHRRCFHCFSRTMTIRDQGESLVLERSGFTESRRRILLVLDGLYVAGAQRHCLSSLEAFSSFGFECTVLALEGGGRWADRFAKAARRVVISPTESPTWEQIEPHVRSANCELVIVHLVAPIIWSIYNIPTAFKCYAHLHCEPSEHEDISNNTLHTLLSRCDRVFVPSHATRESYLGRMGFPNDGQRTSSKLRVLPNGFVSQYMNECTDSTAFIPKLDGSRNIAVISRLDADKVSIPLFIESIARVYRKEPKLKVKVAGDGECKPEIQRAVSDVGLSSVVQFLGFVDDIAQIYNWADVIFLPSKRESMPYVLLESIEMSKPLVAPASGFLRGATSSNLILPFPLGDAAAASRLILTTFKKLDQSGRFDQGENRALFMKGAAWSSALLEAYELI